MTIAGEVTKLQALLEEALVDAQKADKGNKAAGTRLRKAMQQLKTGAQDVRVAVIAKRS
jgi:hypothetical protein|tara:strand:- start:1068 stop:1244 length:177 start_codon:yes stop_codon:yes gene_type:complete